MPTPQSSILPPAGTHGLFLTLHLADGADDSARRVAAGLPALLAEIAGLGPADGLVATLAFGPELWGRLADQSPKGLHPFTPLGSGELAAPATGGDLLLHCHSRRVDLNYLLARRFVEGLGGYIAHADETQGFQYLDSRDLTGFIDGTENPEGEAERAEAALIGAEQPDFEGGSFVLAQRYVHQMPRWSGMSQAEQEGVIGRTRPDSVELDDEVKPPTAHISRVVIEEGGEELEIVRHSLPYGQASGEAGLFFLAYARDLTIFDRMLARMYGVAGDGLHDRLMEFTRPVSGGYFFAPPLEGLVALGR